MVLLPCIAFALPAYEDIDGTIYHPLEEQVIGLGGKIELSPDLRTIEIQCPAGKVILPASMPAVKFMLNNQEHETLMFDVNIDGYKIIYAPEAFFKLTGFNKPAPKDVVTYTPEEDSNIRVYLNGRKLDFDVPPILINGRTLVPMRLIFESLGARVGWDKGENKVTGTLGDTVIKLYIGNKIATIGTKEINLDVPPMLINGRALVPLRFISESFGADVNWDNNSRTISIEK